MSKAARAVAKDLKRKRTLENKFRFSLLHYFNRIARDLKTQGEFIDVGQYDSELTDVLNEHYNDVFSEFSRSTGIVPTTEERALMESTFMHYAALNIPDKVKHIRFTTREHVTRAYELAHGDKAVQDLFGRERRITTNVIASNVLGQRLKNRTGGIMVIETQQPAEFAKAVEVQVLTGLAPINKEWVAVGDSLMRDIHSTADGQKKKMNEPFIVGGESMHFPGDGSLGASMTNLAGCRCGCYYDKQDILEARRIKV